MAASLSREMSLANDWSIHTSPGNSPRAKAAGGGGGSSGSGHRRQTQWPTGASTGTSTLLDGAPAPTADLGAEEDALPSGLLPYHRAGVSPWLRQGATTSNKSPQNEPSTSSHASSGANKNSFPGKDDDTEAQKAEYLGSGPRSSLDLHLCCFEFIVPSFVRNFRSIIVADYSPSTTCCSKRPSSFATFSPIEIWSTRSSLSIGITSLLILSWIDEPPLGRNSDRYFFTNHLTPAAHATNMPISAEVTPIQASMLMYQPFLSNNFSIKE